MSERFIGEDDLENADFEEDDFDCCDHGVGFDEDCEYCAYDRFGCLFPDKCLMPGEHLESECHTAEMLQRSEEQ